MPPTPGRPYLAIPGPSVIPDRVLRAMHQGSPNIYEGPLIEICLLYTSPSPRD